MKGYKKSDVQIDYHSSYSRYPTVNVKAHSFPSVWDREIQKAFQNADTDTLEKALEWAFQLACESFWDYWQDTSGDYENGLYGSREYAYFPEYSVRIDCQGRSGGWLVVEGLPDVESWDAVMLARWAKFEKDVKEDVAYNCSVPAVIESIQSNRWAEEGAEQYNFRDTRQGTVCQADLYRMTHEYPLVTA